MEERKHTANRTTVRTTTCKRRNQVLEDLPEIFLLY